MTANDREFGFDPALSDTLYEYDYYTGSQVLCYFGPVLLDDMVRIGWSVSQQRTPIYGYASQYYKALCAGNVLVNGSFWIAFKESGYVPIILRHLGRDYYDNQPVYRSPAVSPRGGSHNAESLAGGAGLWESNRIVHGANQAGNVQRAGVERLVRQAQTNPDNADVQDDLRDLALELGRVEDERFEDLAEVFEDVIWYGGNRPGNSRNATLSDNFEGGAITNEAALVYRRADQYPPFDMIITFGDINNPAANHTAFRVQHVSIINTELSGIEPSGEPILIRYDFIARNLI